MTKLQVGAQMYSVRDHCTNYDDMLAACREIKAMGYNSVQLSGHDRNAISPEHCRDILDKTGLTCVCTHIPPAMLLEDVDAVVREHKILGCSYPGIGGLPLEYRDTPEGYVEFARRATEASNKLADHGMHMIYHNHAFELYRFPESKKCGLELLMENAGPNFQFEMDLFWIQAGGGNPLTWIKRVAGRMDIVHFKEMNGASKPVLMCPIGEGNMEWPEILRACDEIGVRHALVEQDNAVETNSLDCMRRSHDNLARMGARF